ncbi:dihydroorotase [Aliidongia dinghuensis]|uniref:Dihydroorotase n=1 Tax=Aliidongia dinghuensis TaxID=1867774 RepID=A0A8J2YV97_9PROT|nr:dihydroorotase [Aliidongia dinghuensis]GGF26164.1 dihydroorotase [Aliidongia dinghuensis]
MTAPARPRIDRLTIRRPDDWHVHLRDGAMLEAVVGYTARQFARAIIMPNLVPPVTTAEAAAAYRTRILAALPKGHDFTPLMTCYLTDTTDPDQLADGFARGIFTAAKLYPAKATTNSAFGVTDVTKLTPVFERMAKIGMPLLIHGEVTDAEVDIFDREAVFVDTVLIPLRARVPGLKIVLEHITTAEAAAYVMDAEPGIAATVTPHHLLINRNAIFQGGLRPHAYCLPVAKRESHRQALRLAVASVSDRFFLGTDTAPHPRHAKEAECCAAGVFCAPSALEIYASIFDELGALDRFESFASLNGPRFYGLPVNEGTVTLERAETAIPESVGEMVGGLRPFRAGETVHWRMATL